MNRSFPPLFLIEKRKTNETIFQTNLCFVSRSIDCGDSSPDFIFRNHRIDDTIRRTYSRGQK